jgi:hypothetical protein
MRFSNIEIDLPIISHCFCRSFFYYKLFQFILTIFSIGTVLQCVQQLQHKTPQYLWHVFVKWKQRKYLDDMKENTNEGTAVCQIDYVENFILQNQDQISYAHWSKK